MASTADPSGDQKLRKPITIQRKPFMLKDYLRDDLLSSCSSSGFKSFPRQQCCITVRLLLEVDLKENKKQRLLRRSRSKVAASTTISAMQRASKKVISAFKKQLPLQLLKSASPSPSAQNIGRKVTVPISLWRKLFFRQNFFRKTNKEEGGIRRWRLFREMLSEKEKESDRDTHDSSSTIVGRRVLSSGNRWAETRREFSTPELTRWPSGGKSKSSSKNDVAVGKSDLPENRDSNNVGEEDSISAATTTTYSGANKEEWPNEEEKEQFSPVSVLDFPFEDDEHTNAPNFQINPACIEGSGSGSKQKRMHKTRRFESCLAQTEAVNLEKRIAALSEPNHETPESHEQPRSMPTTLDNRMFEDKEDEQQQTEQNAQELFHLIDSTTKRSTNGAITKAENPPLLDFLRERIEENNASASTTRGKCNGFEHELLSKVEEDWLRWNPGPGERVLGWEVQDARKVYLMDMEKGGNWMMTLVEEKVVALDTEVEVWTCLLNELVLDLFFS